MSASIALAERGLVPDPLLRWGIRKLCRQRLRDEGRYDTMRWQARYQEYLRLQQTSPIATASEASKQQHYEVPTEFYQQVLGPHMKYSSCLYERSDLTLEQAEEAMLRTCVERAELCDGQTILELGCGWGSLTLWMAQQFPAANIVAVSNSATQRQFIQQQMQQRNIDNIKIITEDVNQLQLEAEQFDRVVSVEMFEHVRNHRQLMSRIYQWLKPQGKLFVHIFCHRFMAYPFDVQDESDWMSEYFFTGGVMPSLDSLLHCQQQLVLSNRWAMNGQHYQRTAEAWLNNMDRARSEIFQVFEKAYKEDANVWFNRWRIFFLSCAELFGYDGGNEWLVAHYQFCKPQR